MFKKNISDGVGSPNGLNGTPLDPSLFWLDNIFKQREIEDDIGTYAAYSIPAPASQLDISAHSRWRKGRKTRKFFREGPDGLKVTFISSHERRLFLWMAYSQIKYSKLP